MAQPYCKTSQSSPVLRWSLGIKKQSNESVRLTLFNVSNSLKRSVENYRKLFFSCQKPNFQL